MPSTRRNEHVRVTIAEGNERVSGSTTGYGNVAVTECFQQAGNRLRPERLPHLVRNPVQCRPQARLLVPSPLRPAEIPGLAARFEQDGNQTRRVSLAPGSTPRAAHQPHALDGVPQQAPQKGDSPVGGHVPVQPFGGKSSHHLILFMDAVHDDLFPGNILRHD